MDFRHEIRRCDAFWVDFEVAKGRLKATDCVDEPKWSHGALGTADLASNAFDLSV